jgi:hypothetical protein
MPNRNLVQICPKGAEKSSKYGRENRIERGWNNLMIFRLPKIYKTSE